jgi:putative ABC transport system ATP-binding protein
METVVKATNVKKVYGLKGSIYTALYDINLTIETGEFVGIMGPSGSGKSTLLHVLSTIDHPTSGDIFIDNTNLSQMDEDQLSAFRRDKLGFIFQDYNLLDTLTVRENILLPLALAKIKARDLNQKADRIAEQFFIDSILDKYPYQISGGQRQRTAVCRAIITNPSLLLADEPTGALDSRSATDLLECLKELNETDKTTILMVTHDAFAASYCKRVLFIKDGTIFTELVKGNTSRKNFFKKILDTLSVLGGNGNDSV